MTSYTEEYIKQKLIEELNAVHVVSFFSIHLFTHYVSRLCIKQS